MVTGGNLGRITDTSQLERGPSSCRADQFSRSLEVQKVAPTTDAGIIPIEPCSPRLLIQSIQCSIFRSGSVVPLKPTCGRTILSLYRVILLSLKTSSKESQVVPAGWTMARSRGRPKVCNQVIMYLAIWVACQIVKDTTSRHHL